MALHLAVMCRLNHFKAININRENDFRVRSVDQCQYGSRHYSEDQLFSSPQTNIAGQLSPRWTVENHCYGQINDET